MGIQITDDNNLPYLTVTSGQVDIGSLDIHLHGGARYLISTHFPHHLFKVGFTKFLSMFFLGKLKMVQMELLRMQSLKYAIDIFLKYKYILEY